MRDFTGCRLRIEVRKKREVFEQKTEKEVPREPKRGDLILI